jgi:hypothetical protein
MTPYDHVPPDPPTSGEPASPAPYPAYKRSGSQKRRRKYFVQVAFDEAEYADAKARARRVGLSLASYGRLGMIGTPGPRAQRTPHIHAEAIGAGTAALNKIGVLFNQIAHVLNAGGALSMGQKYLDALDDVRLTLRAIREAVGRKDRDDNQGEPA